MRNEVKSRCITGKRIVITLFVLVILVLGYGGFCKKSSSKKDTTTGSSTPTVTVPAQVTSPLPVDGATDVITTTQLSWSSASGDTSYDVYFGTTNPPPYQTNTVSTSFNPSVLSYSTTYYWRIDSKNNAGTTTGNVWSFQTIIVPWVQVVAGGSHTVARKGDGTLWAWGNNQSGQLGLGDTTNRNTPTSIGAFSDWLTVTAASCGWCGVTIGLKINSTLWSWGINNSGQLGLGDTISRTTPTQIIIGTDSDWVSITAGGHHVIARKPNYTLWAWGYNGSGGALGLGDTIDRWTPTSIGTTSDWTMVIAGGTHNIGLKTDSTIWSWGYNSSGQLGLGDTIARQTPTQMGNGSDWSLFDAGYSHTIVLKTNRMIWTWGNNYSGQLGLGDTIDRNTPTQMGTVSDWSVVASKGNHTIAHKTNGTLWAWGWNGSGQLGLGDTIVRNTATQIGTGSDWYTVSSDMHNIALKTNGTLWVWGLNNLGQLGLGDTIDRNIPCQLGSPATPSSLTATIVSSSQINLSWTDNSFNEDGFKIERKVRMSGTYQQIAVVEANITSYSDTTVTDTENILYCYRIKAYNTVGDSAFSNEAYPVIWITIDAGSNYSLGIKFNRTLWAWGNNDYYQFGDGTTTQRTTPSQIGLNSDWFTISGGNGYDVLMVHTIGIKTNCTIWAWGSNGYGQLGDGTQINRYTPRKIGIASDWVQGIAGCTHTVAMKINGTIWAWGSNAGGQLGDGTLDLRYTPRQIGTDSDWSKLTAKADSLGIKNNRTLWAWGYNYGSILGLGDDINRTTPSQVGIDSDWSIVVAGRTHTMALKTNGSLWAWGSNSDGQLGEGQRGDDSALPNHIGADSDWSGLAAGFSHSLGIKTNGTIYAWGANYHGQLGDGTTITDEWPWPSRIGIDRRWIGLIAGDSYSMGIKNDGTIWSWGANSKGQLGLGDTIERWTPTMIGE